MKRSTTPTPDGRGRGAGADVDVRVLRRRAPAAHRRRRAGGCRSGGRARRTDPRAASVVEPAAELGVELVVRRQRPLELRRRAAARATARAPTRRRASGTPPSSRGRLRSTSNRERCDDHRRSADRGQAVGERDPPPGAGSRRRAPCGRRPPAAARGRRGSRWRSLRQESRRTNRAGARAGSTHAGRGLPESDGMLSERDRGGRRAHRVRTRRRRCRRSRRHWSARRGRPGGRAPVRRSAVAAGWPRPIAS